MPPNKAWLLVPAVASITENPALHEKVKLRTANISEFSAYLLFLSYIHVTHNLKAKVLKSYLYWNLTKVV